jgi:DNA-binding response OmpR family regulator
VLRRSAPSDGAAPSDQLVVGDLEVDLRSRRVRCNGEAVDLTPREYDLLVYLASDAGAVLTRDQIMCDVWDENWWGPTKTLDVHVASLRRKLGAGVIETVRGVGFMVPVEPTPS